MLRRAALALATAWAAVPSAWPAAASSRSTSASWRAASASAACRRRDSCSTRSPSARNSSASSNKLRALSGRASEAGLAAVAANRLAARGVGVRERLLRLLQPGACLLLGAVQKGGTAGQVSRCQGRSFQGSIDRVGAECGGGAGRLSVRPAALRTHRAALMRASLRRSPGLPICSASSVACVLNRAASASAAAEASAGFGKS